MKERGRLRSIFQGSAIGIALLDMKGNAVECNDYLIELLGFESGELRNMPFVDLNHPEDREHSNKLLAELVEGKRKRFQVEKRLCGKDRQPVWVRVTASRIRSEQRNMDYIIKIIENINDRKLAEASLRTSEWKFRVLFDNMKNGFIYNQAVYDDSGDVSDYLFLEANQAFEQLLNIPRDEVVGKLASQLQPETCQSLLGWIDTYGKAALTGQDIRFEHYCQQTDQWLAISVYSPQEDYFATIIEDIDTQHRLQEEMQTYAEQIDTYNRELKMIMKGVSHKVREPFQAIIEKNVTGKTIESAEQIRRLLDDLEQYAGLMSPEMAFTPVDLSILACEAISKQEQHLHEIGAQIEIGQLPSIWGNSIALSMLFSRLIDNAIQFRGKQPLHLAIISQKVDNDWQISIRDNGIGLASEYHERAFDIFWKFPDTPFGGGNGMGLSLCKRIVDLHGGRIWIESKENQGMTVRFTLASQRTQ